MPCPHYDIAIVKPVKASVVAKAAYQSGERLYSDREHRTKKYKKARLSIRRSCFRLRPRRNTKILAWNSRPIALGAITIEHVNRMA